MSPRHATAVALPATPVPTRRRIALLLVVAGLITTVATLLASSSRAATSTPARPFTPARASYIAHQMLQLLNRQRAENHLPALRWAPRLVTSAHWHNLHMAQANVMAHRLPRERYFADRITRTGYRWRTAGENIGWNRDATAPGALYLERVMYGEHAPNDGHRVNILSRQFTQVGINVYYDAVHHKMWFTQDFGSKVS
jgi:uncharacterized protein YkwD